MAIARDEFETWLEHPGTKALKDRIRRDVTYMKDMLVIESDYETIQRLQERIKVSSNFLDVSYEDIVNE